MRLRGLGLEAKILGPGPELAQGFGLAEPGQAGLVSSGVVNITGSFHDNERSVHEFYYYLRFKNSEYM